MDLDISQYMNIFVEEAREHLQSMNDVLLELEKNPDNLDHINEIFRVAHTIKGMSGTMGFTAMANLTHDMENVLSGVRNREMDLSGDIIDVLFECFDALDSSVNNIIETGTEVESDNIELVNKLNLIIQGKKLPHTNQAVSERPSETEILPNGKRVMEDTIQAVIQKAKQEGLSIFKIQFTLSADCALKAARAFIVFNTLEASGEIIKSDPSAEEIEEEKFGSSFQVFFVTGEGKERLMEELESISEIEKIECFDLSEQGDYVELLNAETLHVGASKDSEDYKADPSTVTEKEINKPQDKRDDHRPVKNSGANKTAKTVRVDIDRLDNLMNLVSELIIIKTRMDDLSENTTGEKMSDTIEYLERITSALHEAVMKVRMVPIERVFNRFPRLVRDLSKELNKQIELEMTGEETEVDRTVIDEIGDPLIHLIRNSIDHGIEQPDVRKKKGKVENGTVILKAYPDGNNVVIEVEDNGAGIDEEKVVKKAIQKGLIDEKDAPNMTTEDKINLLFAPGFSTADVVSDVSGRGVGLDVVKSKIEAINGIVEVETEKNVGTKFIIRIPLTLAIINALLIKLADEIYAIPLNSITEIINVKASMIRNIQGRDVVLNRGKTLPVIKLKNLLQIEDQNDREDLIVVVIKKGEKQAGVIVDTLIGQQEIVIKSLGKYLSGIKFLSGATILGNGNISLILDVNSII